MLDESGKKKKKKTGELCKYFAYRLIKLDYYGELGGTLWQEAAMSPWV